MAEPLPAGWGSGQLDSGQPYWFRLAAPADIQFEAPATAEAQQQTHAGVRHGERRTVALHSWNNDAGADAKTDLIFSKGTDIVVVSDQPGQGWLTGKLLGDATNRTGIFPANFVTLTDAGGGGGGSSAAAADLHDEGGAWDDDGAEERSRSPDPGKTTPRSRSPDPGDASRRRARSPDPGDLRRARSPDPDSNQKALAIHRERSLDPDGKQSPHGGRSSGRSSADGHVLGEAAADDPLELQKQSGAFVYDEATQVRAIRRHLPLHHH